MVTDPYQNAVDRLLADPAPISDAWVDQIIENRISVNPRWETHALADAERQRTLQEQHRLDP